jgi:Kef-type K+ transport system membrane component KefB
LIKVLDPNLIALIILTAIFIASLISVRFAISVAIIEIAMGAIVGNIFQIQPPDWMIFLATFGSILLTFLAGAEVDPKVMKEKFKESMLIGVFSFAVPFVATLLYCHYVAKWDWKAAEIAGCALSTTSLAVIYAVLVETGLTKTKLGKIIMASCFITDIGTAAALSILFSDYNWKSFIFIAVSVVLILIAPKLFPKIFKRYEERVIEPDIKFIFVILFIFIYIASIGAGHAVLPVFVLGLVLSKSFRQNIGLQRKLRTIAFAMITPFFFMRGGMIISFKELGLAMGLLGILFGLKIATKFIGVYPFARKYLKGSEIYTTLLMSTGLTFGTISSIYGFEHGFINKTQFSLLVTVVILTAIIPTFIAQKFFQPKDTLDFIE